ncbi:AraC-like DNA-binding protein [Variovorax boronicumulans]|nr:AraC-like DNA-binding protein [Variovorax boronicumulans]
MRQWHVRNAPIYRQNAPTRQAQVGVFRDCGGAIRSVDCLMDSENQSLPIARRSNSILDFSVWPGWRLLMQDAGLATSPVLRRAQLPADLFTRQNVRLDSANFFRLWEALEAEALSIDPNLPAPLRIAQVMTSDWFDPELFAALCSADMNGALERIAKYVKLIAPMAIRLERTTAHTTVTIDFLDPTERPPSVFLAFKLVFFVQLARLATRSPVQPLRVSWPSPPATQAETLIYTSFFGMPVTDAPLATLVFAAADVEHPFLTENHKMWSFFEPSLRQRLADLDRSAGMAERVRSTLLETLPAGEVSMQAVSRKLAVSTRTLQRRLRDEGTSFQQTLDALRDSLAHHYLRNTEMSSAEISFLLGFEDSNSFARAFHVWTGKTPQTVRSEMGEVQRAG